MRSAIEHKTLDPVATRASILAAATKLFSAKGMAATTTSEIAAEAGVTKSLVLYHFSTKEELWKAVLLAKAGPFFEATSAFLSDAAPVDVRKIAKAKFDRMRSDPEFARLMAWMSLEATMVAPEMQSRVTEMKARIERNPEASGIPTGLDPALFMALLMSSIDGYFRFRQMYSVMVGQTLVTKDAENNFFDVLMKVMFSHLNSLPVSDGV